MNGLAKLLLMIVVVGLVVSGHAHFVFIGFFGFIGLCLLSSVIDYMFPSEINKSEEK